MCLRKLRKASLPNKDLLITLGKNGNFIVGKPRRKLLNQIIKVINSLVIRHITTHLYILHKISYP